MYFRRWIINVVGDWINFLFSLFVSIGGPEITTLFRSMSSCTHRIQVQCTSETFPCRSMVYAVLRHCPCTPCKEWLRNFSNAVKDCPAQGLKYCIFKIKSLVAFSQESWQFESDPFCRNHPLRDKTGAELNRLTFPQYVIDDRANRKYFRDVSNSSTQL